MAGKRVKSTIMLHASNALWEKNIELKDKEATAGFDPAVSLVEGGIVRSEPGK